MMNEFTELSPLSKNVHDEKNRSSLFYEIKSELDLGLVKNDDNEDKMIAGFNFANNESGFNKIRIHNIAIATDIHPDNEQYPTLLREANFNEPIAIFTRFEKKWCILSYNEDLEQMEWKEQSLARVNKTDVFILIGNKNSFRFATLKEPEKVFCWNDNNKVSLITPNENSKWRLISPDFEMVRAEIKKPPIRIVSPTITLKDRYQPGFEQQVQQLQQQLQQQVQPKARQNVQVAKANKNDEVSSELLFFIMLIFIWIGILFIILLPKFWYFPFVVLLFLILAIA